MPWRDAELCFQKWLPENRSDGRYYPLAKERPIPDPLTSGEYQRVVAACPTLQFQNMVIFAVNTGVRHGELSALSREDVDTVNWTVTVSRNYSLKGNFTLPKPTPGFEQYS